MYHIRKIILTALICILFGIPCAGIAHAETEMPMLAAGSGWYPFSVAKSNILSVEFRDFYEPDGTEADVRNTDVWGRGEIRSYLLAGRKKVIVAGNGSGGILANPDCSGMFEGFRSLGSVCGFELIDTSDTTDLAGMFLDCSSLVSADLAGLNTEKVTDMSRMFKNCNSLEYVDLQYWDLSNVEDMSYMFSNCASIDNLTFRLMRETKLQDVSSMFSDCYELKNLDVFGVKTDNVRSMQKMFMNCYSLTSVDFSHWNIENVTDTSWMFSGCINISSINLYGWVTGKVQHMDMMFSGCSSLTDLSIHWDTSSLTTAEGLFQDCSSMSEVNLSGFSGENLLNADGMFSGCTGLEVMDLGGMKLKSIVSSTQSDLFGDTVYPKLQSFSPPLGVRISMKLPESGNGRFLLEGKTLTEIPKNLEAPLVFSVCYFVEFLDNEDGTVYASETAEWGRTVATPSQPVKESEDFEFTFLGWYLGNGEAYREEPVYSDIKAYAFWEKTEKEKEEEEYEDTPADQPEEEQENKNTEEPAGESAGSSSSGSSSSGSSSGSSSSGGSSGSSSSGSSSGGGSGLSYRSSGMTPSGSRLTVANVSATFSSFWKADAKGTWRVVRPDGKTVTSAWLCDDAVTANGKNVWYLLDVSGEMVSCGLVQDNTGNYYSLETTHNGYYGMLRCRNGFYTCGNETLYITFNHSHNGSFGAITSQEALETLKQLYGVTKFSIGNENCIYTSSF